MGEDLRERFQTLHEIVRAAHQTLDPGAWDYLAGGTETETTLRRNRQALDSIAFRPRVLRDVSKVDTTATLLGRTLRLPIMLAPVGSIETFTPGGAATAARGATADDAEIACEHGVEGVYVSNHGGRQLDHGRGSADVLPEVVAAVRKRALVIVDGSFVRGTDVVKALALGADCVGMGRIACCGLGAAGADGLVRVLELLEDEVRICLGLLGVTRFAELDASYLHRAEPVTAPRVFSAFPLMDEGY